MYEAGNQGEGFGAGGYAMGYSPAQQAEWKQRIIDDEQLRLLRIGYFISAGQAALFIPLGLLYAGMGVFFSVMPPGASSSPPPGSEMTWIFAAFGGVVTLIATAMVALKFMTAVRLKARRSRMLCMVSAALCFIEIPYGTALGLMTFLVLARSSVKAQFEE
ncbi:MAG TPA: hypothetical protein VFQ35_25340 [Polyangiaceae bacterium]|nr:hypothetical protein [Polyangiaceae bacterium]